MVVKCPNCGQQVRGQPGQSGPCPKCGTRLRFPDGDAQTGELITCPHCGQNQRYTAGRCINCGKEISPKGAEKSIPDTNMKERPQDKNGGTELLLGSILFFLISGYFLFQTYDTITNYKNLGLSSVNAYVGGDAYNYIINGTYSTTYAVIALIFVVCGFGCLILRAIKRK